MVDVGRVATSNGREEFIGRHVGIDEFHVHVHILWLFVEHLYRPRPKLTIIGRPARLN